MREEYFTYEQDAPFKVFPIDFSLREFDTTHKGNFSRAQAVVQHPFLDNVLLKLIWDDDFKESKFFPAYEGIYPLPVEAETFLRCFYELIEKGDYHTTPKTGKKLENPELKRKFSKDLCRGIAKRVFPPEADPHFDDTVYCRHMLCHNEGFCRVLVDDLWPNAIKNRIKQIELLAMNVSPVQQTLLLQEVLLALDNMCLGLIHSTPSKIAKPSSTPPLPDELLGNLLSKRVKIPESKNEVRPTHKKRAVYKVKRINLETKKSGKAHKITLESAFKTLQNHRNPDPELMKQARIAYIESLEKSVEQSQFEEQYLEFQKYLNVTSEQPTLNDLELLFTDIMKKQCGYEIDRIMGVIDGKVIPSPQTRYLDKLIYDAASLRVFQGMQNFQEALYLVNEFSKIDCSGKKLDGICTLARFTTDDGTEHICEVELPPYIYRKRYFRQLQEFFVRYWTFSGRERPIDETNRFIDIENVANEFAQGAREAAIFLGKGEALVRSAEDTKELLQFCEDSVTQENAHMPAHKIASLSFPILVMAILQTLQRIVTDGVSSLLKDFSVLQEIQKQIQEQDRSEL